MQKTLIRLRLIVAAVTLVLALALCYQCIDLYQTGNAPANLDESGVHLTPVYTSANVAARLRPFAIPAALWLVLIAVTAFLQSRVPAGKDKPTLPPDNRLRLMKRRVSALPEGAIWEERLRRNTWLATAAILLACAALSCTFLLNGANFTSWDLEPVMAELLLHVAPWVAVGLLTLWAALRTCDASMLRECEILKSAPQEKPAEMREKPFPVGVLRVGLYAAAIAFIVLGVMNGGLRDVLIKAINICTECIGLG